MDAPPPPPSRLTIPWRTMLMVGGAVTVAALPGASGWLVYDRSAVLSGQIWRMFTAHWVHFSTRHLAFDALALGVAGWIAEDQKLPRFGWFCVLAPWFMSAIVFVAEPQMKCFGGLSGMATAVIALVGLAGLYETTPWRRVCVIALMGVAGKILYELASGRSMFVPFKESPVVVAVPIHIAAVTVALTWFVVSRFRQCKAHKLQGVVPGS